MTDARPLLLIDVDGPLNPYAAEPEERPDGFALHVMRPLGWEEPLQPLRVWLRPEHGPQLLSLPYELVWCTTWEADANEWIGPRVGLPELEYISFEGVDSRDVDESLYFKTPTVVDWARGRAFAWIDDQVTDADREYVADHHPAPALLITVSPSTGLLPEHVRQLAEWAAGLEQRPAR